LLRTLFVVPEGGLRHDRFQLAQPDFQLRVVKDTSEVRLSGSSVLRV
jgi:hypothetical protein